MAKRRASCDDAELKPGEKLPPVEPEVPRPPRIAEPMDSARSATLAAGFKALADPVRLRLLSLVASHLDGEACVCDLVGAFDLTQPTISHHLKILRDAGLVESTRRGTWVYYRLVPEAVTALTGVIGIPLPAR
ncbi:ArsR/SmtB family transcription factor [Amycolatopsis tolypomycina]|uniref:DNA-binding transcriptional regulator, ArsR family n=1 Tax=Amycolatopsis tolypomycina TaxID=208445 RepID=A0A1H4Y2A3_9PSEU|nr:DNA-binding transcriptional regulator, ArsR family [Amycolatopsis tolypomycina]